MKLSHLLTPELIKVGLENSTKEKIIQELIDIVVAQGLVSDTDQAFMDVMSRELQQSTGLEAGIAVPHGKSTSVDQLVGALGISEEGIDFASLDGKPSHLFFLLIAPPNMSGPHVRALANIAKFSQNSRYRNMLTEASSSEEAYRIIKQAETEDI
ncbi:MAG: PTS sugar transporter subunit IIA [Candidatus Auribacterota bacterium]|jgi:mannitol/fructose-specific phosphotransferase system IIA component (Ntr-type)|nr:PTS sugar transporter subunit IIA [Candidatus Auribacterota bacterium]